MRDAKEDIPQIINQILSDLIKQFNVDRAYIIEIDRERRIQNCTYEAAAEEVSKEKELLQNVPWNESYWWDRQILEKNPIILRTLDDLPPEAQQHRDLLEAQNIKSLMVVPLLSKDEVWGYIGFDMVKTERTWIELDLQWFSSLANILSICIELRKSEIRAKEDRRALDHSEKVLRNIYKNLPAGIELYDKDGYLIDINDKECEIFGLSDKEKVLGICLFDNPNIPESVKNKLRAREDVNFSIDYDFSIVNEYIKSSREGIMNLTSKVTTLYDSHNQFTNYLIINIDTTETTNAYTKITKTNRFYPILVERFNISSYL